ncbi:MAG: hypothetical protein PHV68_06255 [Candidatus Gastranaerophilales bacterium]|nr:hypothetical protein [Candidatus Gastranaerophilales bacterium]
MKINSIQTQKINNTKPNQTVATSVPLRGDAKDTLELSGKNQISFGGFFSKGTKSVVQKAIESNGYTDLARKITRNMLEPFDDESVKALKIEASKDKVWGEYIQVKILRPLELLGLKS